MVTKVIEGLEKAGPESLIPRDKLREKIDGRIRFQSEDCNGFEFQCRMKFETRPAEKLAQELPELLKFTSSEIKARRTGQEE